MAVSRAYEPEKLDAEKLEQVFTAGVSAGNELAVNDELEREVVKKFDRRIVPWLFGIWLLAFIDRSNIGNARIDGLATELKLNGESLLLLLMSSSAQPSHNQRH